MSDNQGHGRPDSPPPPASHPSTTATGRPPPPPIPTPAAGQLATSNSTRNSQSPPTQGSNPNVNPEAPSNADTPASIPNQDGTTESSSADATVLPEQAGSLTAPAPAVTGGSNGGIQVSDAVSGAVNVAHGNATTAAASGVGANSATTAANGNHQGPRRRITRWARNAMRSVGELFGNIKMMSAPSAPMSG